MALPQKTFIRSLVCVLSFLPLSAFALSPVVQFNDLVAGSGEAGFRDGAFYASQFDHPYGLALGADAQALYVADRDNNRIRVVHLDRDNAVETLAGNGTAGAMDGPCSIATFDHPTALAVLPDDKMAVAEQGSGHIRFIDTRTNVVSCLVAKGQADGSAFKFGAIWNLAYLPDRQALYISQPSNGILWSYDLKTGKVEDILKADVRIPHPKALCVFEDKLYVADQDLPTVYEVGFPKTEAEGNTSVPAVDLRVVGQAHGVIALSGTRGSLYCCQGDPQEPLMRLKDSKPVSFESIWADRAAQPDFYNLPPAFRNVRREDPMGLVPDPRSPGRFFIANPCTCKIESFRDLHQAEFKPDLGEDLVNEGKLHDFSYPDEKPPRTIRILLVGRCYLYWQASGSPYEKTEEGNRTKDFMWTLAKRTQILLNTRAALEGSPYHYEVFNGGMHHGSRYTNIWANYVVPPAVQKYGIDLVLIMQEQGIGSVIPFLQTPITSEGIPADGEDPEYLLTPISEKLKGGPVRDLLDLCRRRKVLMEASKINWDINMDKALDDTQVRPALVDLLKMPLVTLKKRMENAKFEGGKTAKMEVWYYPITPYLKRKDRDLARDICLKAGVPFLDICDDFDVLSSTYHPYRIPAEEPGYFTRNGMDLFAQIMVHELLKNHTIPFDAPSAR